MRRWLLAASLIVAVVVGALIGLRPPPDRGAPSRPAAADAGSSRPPPEAVVASVPPPARVPDDAAAAAGVGASIDAAPRGTLLGRVEDLSGTGIADVAVTLFGRPERRESEQRWVARASAITDSAGRFRVAQLTPGLYRVDPTPPDGFLPVPESEVVIESPDRPPGYFAQVARIPKGGGEVALTIVLLRPGRVRGIVLDAAGRAVPEVLVRLQGFDLGRQGVHAEATSDAEGRFEIAAPPSRYRVRSVVGPESPLSAICQPPPLEFELREGELRDLTPLRFGGEGCSVSGRVLDDLGHAFSGLDVLCWFGEEAAVPHDWSNALLRATSDATGTFRLDGLPACRVAVSVAPEGFLPGNEATNVLAWFLAPLTLDLRRDRHVELPPLTAMRHRPFVLDVVLDVVPPDAERRHVRVEIALRDPRDPAAPPWVLDEPRELRPSQSAAGAAGRTFRWICSTPHPPVVVRGFVREKGRRVVFAEQVVQPMAGEQTLALPVP